MGVIRFLLVFSLFAVAACAKDSFDAEQARLCRLVLPALHQDGASIDVLNEAVVDAPGARITYRLRAPPEAARVVRTTCGFAGARGEAGRFDLISVAIDGRPLSDVQLYILRRWWLEPLGVAAMHDPSSQPLTGGIETSFRTAYFIQQVANGLPLGAVYALLAIAYSLVYGLARRIVLSFGDMAVMGSYGVLFGVGSATAIGMAHPAMALAVGFASGLVWAILVGLLAGRCVIEPLASRSGQAMIVATLGLGIAIQESLRLTQGASDKWLAPMHGASVVIATSSSGFTAVMTVMQVAVGCGAFALVALTLCFMRRSAFGRSWMAMADDARAAELMGIDPRRVMIGTMALGGALAGAAGWVLLVHYGGVGFSNGLAVGLKALIAAVIGGIGSPGGAVLGGLLVGLAETLWSGYFASTWRDVVVLGSLALFLAVRPGGLFGFPDAGPRRI